MTVAPTAPREALVLSEQLRAVYAGMKPAAIAGTLGPILIAAMYWEQVARWRLIVWWCLVAATLGVGSLLLSRRFAATNALPTDAGRWLRHAVIRALAVSLAYGSAGVFLFTPSSETHQIILFAWLIAISALVTVETANHHWLYPATLVPMLAPFILRAVLHAEQTSLILAASAAILLVYLMVGARKLNRLIVESLNSRFANLELVAQLQQQMAIAEDARLEAVGANSAKSRFLAAASHDLRQPVHALGLFVAALRPHVAGEAGGRILDRVDATVGSTAALFDAMLDVSRLDAGVLVPEVTDFALAPLLRRVGDEYAPLAAAKGLDLRVRVGQQAVSSDPTLLERIIRNYLDNAVRHAVRGSVLLAARRRGDTVRIEVWDTGPGIPAGQLGAIYEEFFQLANASRDRARGLGLGLAIVQRIARLLGHPIDVVSRVGRGSRFSVTVAACAAPAIAGRIDETTRGSDVSLLVGATVLVIDDDAGVRDSLEILLRQWGCLVLAADGAPSAIALVRGGDVVVDIVVADFRLRDGETGIAAIAAIRREVGAVPALLISGDTAPDRLREAAAGGIPLLHKPLDAARLREAICQLASVGLRR